MHQESVESAIARAREQDARALDLSGRELTELPPAIGQLSGLELLDLSDNQLRALPEEIGGLANLQLMDLRGNQLTDLPASLGRLHNLAFLRLGGNQFETLPSVIGELRALRRLVLRGNRLATLPDWLHQLEYLQELSLGDNLIAKLPAETLNDLPRLEALLLYGNPLHELPEGLSNLKRLKRLDLRGVPLHDLPADLSACHALMWLDLRESGLPLPERAVAEPARPRQILESWRQAKESHRKPLAEAKLMVLGDAKCGKSAIAYALASERFDPRRPPTEGVSILSSSVIMPGGLGETRLNVWDFSGDPLYAPLFPYLLSPNGIVMLVIDGAQAEPERRLAHWMRIIRSRCGRNAPVALVCARADAFPLELDWLKIRERHPTIRAIVRRASSVTGEGVEQIRQALIKTLEHLPRLREPVWRSWHEIKATLVSLNTEFAPFRFFEALCLERGAPALEDQEALAQLMHDLGCVVYFRNHPVAGSTDDLLEPVWITQALSRLLGSANARGRGGLFQRADLSAILDMNLHAAKRHEMLLGLARRFALAIPRYAEATEPQQPGARPKPVERFCIPAMLPVERKLSGAPKEYLGFCYQFDSLPPALLGQCMVRLAAFLHGELEWREGVALASEGGGNRALLTLDPLQSRLTMQIWGQTRNRSVFLQLIRLTLERLLSLWPDFAYRRLLQIPDGPDLWADVAHLESLREQGSDTYWPPAGDKPLSVAYLLSLVEPEPNGGHPGAPPRAHGARRPLGAYTPAPSEARTRLAPPPAEAIDTTSRRESQQVDAQRADDNALATMGAMAAAVAAADEQERRRNTPSPPAATSEDSRREPLMELGLAQDDADTDASDSADAPRQKKIDPPPPEQ
ncbi:COR domain-containing protein [Magnetofaba australis]|nr:COR domain-containing protein [Magnetofaba australis]